MNRAERFWKELKGTILVYEEVERRRITIPNKQKQIEKQKINIQRNIDNMQYQEGLDFVLSNITKFHNLVKELFIDMNKFGFRETESVSQKYDTVLLNYNNRFKMLTEVDLYAHTMNVVVETIKLQDVPQETKNIAIIIALLHDYGKNAELQKKYKFEENETEKHNHISANYAKYKLQNERFSHKSKDEITNELIDLIVDTLRNHHDSKAEPSLFLNLLRTADINARENELKGILLLQQRRELHKKQKES